MFGLLCLLFGGLLGKAAGHESPATQRTQRTRARQALLDIAAAQAVATYLRHNGVPLGPRALQRALAGCTATVAHRTGASLPEASGAVSEALDGFTHYT